MWKNKSRGNIKSRKKWLGLKLRWGLHCISLEIGRLLDGFTSVTCSTFKTVCPKNFHVDVVSLDPGFSCLVGGLEKLKRV